MSQVYVPAREYHEHWPKSAALLYQAPTNTRRGASGPIQTARPYANATHERPSWSPEPSLQHTTHTHASSRRVAPQRAMPPAEQQTCEGEDTVEEEFFSKVQEASEAHRPSPR